MRSLRRRIAARSRSADAEPGPNSGERFFGALLWLYPRAFRERFGDEMRGFFRLRRAEVRRAGRAGAAMRLWLPLVADALVSAPREWLYAAGLGLRDEELYRLRAPSYVDDWTPPLTQRRDSMDALMQDLRFAVRTLVRRPGFAIVALLTLALGIGANTAIFSVVNAVLLRALPWPESNRLVMVWGTRGEERQNGVAYLDYRDWQQQTKSFEELGVVRGQSVNLTGGDKPERVIGSFVTANIFRMIGATAAQGRLPTDAETEVPAHDAVAVLSDNFWRTRFGARADVVGTTLVLNGRAFTVIGITRPGLEAPLGTPDVWMPIGYYPNKGDLEVRGRGGVLAVGRVKRGVSLERAQADVDVVTKRLAQLYPTTNAGIGANVQSIEDVIVGPVRTPMLILLSAVGIVLLIACANVANLQLARAAARRRELSVRAALGAARLRIVRQLITESLLLSLGAGAAGVLLAHWGTKALAASVADSIPVYGTIGIEPRVLVFALAITLGAGLLFGSAPAWQLSRAQVHDALTLRGDSGGGGHRVRSALVVGQVALCVVLLICAGLLTRSLAALGRVNPGFDTDRLLTMQFRLPVSKYATESQIADMFTRTIAEIRAVPGVRDAALVRATPLNGNGETFPYAVSGRPLPDPNKAPTAQVNIVSPGYFATMRIPRLGGRDFAAEDRDGTLPVAIVNDLLARHAWPNDSPLGKRVRIGGDSAWATVVGVVAPTKHFRLAEDPLEQIYVPYMQRPLIFTEVVVRTQGDPRSIANAVLAAVWRVDRDQPVWRVRPMDTVLDAARGGPRLTVWLTTGFGALALILAAIGVYGVMSFTVARRTQEVGIRMALGARSGQVLRMVLREGMWTIGIAVAIGLVAALGATKLVASQLFGVSAADPLTFVAVPAILAVVALAACYLPARRASRVDPLVALRAD